MTVTLLEDQRPSSTRSQEKLMAVILIADDMPDIVVLLASRFRSQGHTVVEAHDGNEALELIKRERPDVAILDVMMPELNGFQVCRQVKTDSQLSSIPVVLLTAKDSDADQFWGSEVGADLYLTKPMDPGSVVNQVDQLLKARA